MQLGEMPELLRAEFLDEHERLRLRRRARALLQLVAELARELPHAAHELRARHDRRRGDDGVLFRVRAHREGETLEALLLQLALHEGLLGKLIEQAALHPLFLERVLERRGVLPGEQPVETRVGFRHQLVVFRHPAVSRLDHDAGRRADEFVELEDLRLDDRLAVAHAGLEPRAHRIAVGDHRRSDHGAEEVALATLVESGVRLEPIGV